MMIKPDYGGSCIEFLNIDSFTVFFNLVEFPYTMKSGMSTDLVFYQDKIYASKDGK